MRKVVVGLLVMLTVGGIVSIVLKHRTSRLRPLRVAFASAKRAMDYEPTKIHLAYEYLLLENLYSTLVELDQNGTIRPAIAESFSWVGQELHLIIQPGLKTSSGIPITSDDVVFSLKRVLVLASNTHGDFKALVCPTQVLASVTDPCSGIRAQGQTVILSAGEKKPFLLSMLTAIDFAVIPQTSVDPKTLRILNYRDNSGAYYVENVASDGQINLRMNPFHFHASRDIAETVDLVPVDRKIHNSDLIALENGTVDHIMTSNASQSEDLITYAASNPDTVTAHATLKIKSKMLVFTERGQKELSIDQRRAIGARVKAVFAAIYLEKAGYAQANEFFAVHGDGGLTEEQSHEIQHLQAHVAVDNIPKFKLGLMKVGDLEEWSVPIRAALPTAEIYRETNSPEFQEYASPAEMPHAFIASGDTGFMEDISLISYSLSAGLFGMSKPDRSKWLASYMVIPEKEKRLVALNALHFEILKNAVLVPLVVSPFVALTRKPWRMELSELYANNQLWLIKHD
jgi:hypothetical protein